MDPEYADFVLDWLQADPEDALTACEVVNPNGKTIYQEHGDPDAQTFLNNLVDALTPLATPVDDEEEDSTDDATT
jgi:hypothetical protein